MSAVPRLSARNELKLKLRSPDQVQLPLAGIAIQQYMCHRLSAPCLYLVGLCLPADLSMLRGIGEDGSLGEDDEGLVGLEAGESLDDAEADAEGWLTDDASILKSQMEKQVGCRVGGAACEARLACTAGASTRHLGARDSSAPPPPVHATPA